MESIESFEQRSFISFPRGIALVWGSANEKNRFGAKRPERWDIATAKRYARILSVSECNELVL